MKITYIIVAFVIGFTCFADPIATDTSDPISATDDFRISLGASDQVAVFEGLPHQSSERTLLSQELNRRDITKFSNYWFYTPAHIPVSTKSLKDLFGSPTILARYGGPKFCGEFHPDYCVFWKGNGQSYSALICFGCHEIIFTEGNRRFIYDIAPESYPKLKEEMKPYATKRPQNKKEG